MIGLIVARSKNNVIGKNGAIPWKIKGEQKQFRELTTGNVGESDNIITFPYFCAFLLKRYMNEQDVFK